MKYEQAFEKMKALLENADTAGFDGDFALQINLKNKDCGGAFYMEYRDGVLNVEPYDYRDNNAMVTIMSGDFVKLIDGTLDLEKAVAKGSVEIVGDYGKAAQIKGIIEPVKKAAAPKKTAKASAPAAKAAEKKTVKKAPAASKKTKTVEKKTK